MSEVQESLLDQPMEELAAEQEAEKESNPEVIEDVLVETPDPVEANTISTTEEEDVVYEKPDNFPDKFWDDKDGPDIEALVKSYGEMEKNFSQGKHKAPEVTRVSKLVIAVELPLIPEFAPIRS